MVPTTKFTIRMSLASQECVPTLPQIIMDDEVEQERSFNNTKGMYRVKKNTNRLTQL